MLWSIKTLSKIFAIQFLLVPAHALASQCDFTTSEYAAEMQRLDSISSLEVNVNKHRKWVKNSLAILTDPNKVIRERFKKKFKAKVTVQYPFGTCRYKAKIRQNGDWKDHIHLRSGGGLIQSLDVKLEDGNIANVVRFKLLLPETRNFQMEVFATQLIRHIGLIAPKTALVDATFNGERLHYLFQEKESKELLEGVRRREGPMFEGDETLIWLKGRRNGEGDAISGARLVNHKWSLRGDSSMRMSLLAFLKVQRAYVQYASTTYPHTFLSPNPIDTPNDPFRKYHALIIALQGDHALFAHNRKFYWNSLEQVIEPIYYDGNVQLTDIAENNGFIWGDPVEVPLYLQQLRDLNFAELRNEIKAAKNDVFHQEFASATGLKASASRTFVDDGLDVVLRNLEVIEARTKSYTEDPVLKNYADTLQEFVTRTANLSYDQFVLVPVDKLSHGSESFLPMKLRCLTGPPCSSSDIGFGDLAALMGANEIGNQRAVLLETDAAPVASSDYATTPVDQLQVLHTKGATVTFKPETRTVHFHQKRPDDWFLIKSSDLSDYKLVFTGLKPVGGGKENKQRFNSLGLTGCLTLYNVTVDQTDISASDGGCEDSLNIISSRGNLKRVLVKRSFADAIDIDFSEVSIGYVGVQNGGNDCLDVSGGIYVIDKAELTSCNDKGVSVGESSRLTAKNLIVTDAGIGVSSKDFSILTLHDYSARETPRCLEAFQKKVEFGGATILADKVECGGGERSKDANSRIIVKGKEIELSD